MTRHELLETAKQHRSRAFQYEQAAISYRQSAANVTKNAPTTPGLHFACKNLEQEYRDFAKQEMAAAENAEEKAKEVA